MAETDPSENATLERAIRGDRDAMADVFESYRGRLSRMLALRMDPRVRGRIDTSDVLQEAYLEASRGLPRYSSDPKIPFYLWLRLLAGQCLAKAHRKHLGTAMRKAQCEVSIAASPVPDLSTFDLAAQLVESMTSVSGKLMRDELRTGVQSVIEQMTPPDREVLALRHFEEMTNREAATVLGITEAAAKSRYRRALMRITEEFERRPELLERFPAPRDGRVAE